MTPNFKKLISLLEELFQLDQPDLDFGLYRIMQAKRAEITHFLENELFSNVKDAIKRFTLLDQATLKSVVRELEKVVTMAEMDPKDSPVATDLHQRIDALDHYEKLESDVYDHLYKFFRRYYSQGDFIAKRVYKSDVYAIPYDGEEIALHWANKDQYYIKSSEYLRNYTFRLRPDDNNHPMRVHFRLSDATETEHNNNKAPNGKERMFVLAPIKELHENFISLEDGPQGKELVLRFEFRRSALTDWPENERGSKKKPPTQQEHILHACQRILSVTGDGFASWIEELGKPHVIKNGNVADYNRLEAHIKRYASRNTFDFFIHKDLEAYLKRELDFYVKNDVMHLDDIQYESVTRVDQFLSKIKVIRDIGGKVIDFLAQIENFQKKLWLKKKFVTETNYCIAVGRIPESFYPEIIENQVQCEEWIQICAIDQINGDLVTPGYNKKVTPEFLNAQPTLMVDTQHFNSDFTSRLLDSIANVSEITDGILFHSDNFQSLSLLQASYHHQTNCIYIDPPYNTAASPILYKNDYKDSSWLSLMVDRLILSRTLLAKYGIICCAIDDEEVSHLKTIMQNLFPSELGTVVVRSNPAGRKSRGQLSPSHEFALFFGNENATPYSLPKTERELARYPFEDELGRYAWNNLIRHGSGDRREDVPTMFFPIYVSRDDQIRIPKLHWVSAERRYEVLEEPKNDEIAVLPIRKNGDQIIEKRWHHGIEKIRNNPSQYRIRRNQDIIDIDFMIRIDTEATPRTWWDDSRFASSNQGSKTAKNLFGHKPFDYPKAIGLVEDCLRVSGLNSSSLVLDYFAGSGTTGHATINLNREDGGNRKFILIEMGEYFDAILLPRLKKVAFTPEWKNGKPLRHASLEEVDRSPRIFKVIRLESYEDALNNLMIHQTDQQQFVLSDPVLNQENRLREPYILRYMLDVETRGSQSLLNIHDFADPESYKLKVKVPSSDESKDINVDLLETFNWLIGLSVKRITAPQKFNATCERDDEKRLRLKGGLQVESSGPYWFRTVTGTLPDGRNALIIWRKLSGDLESDNLVLEHWFLNHCPSYNDSNINVIWVNGATTLENIKTNDHFWTVRLIESDFHRRMFNGE